MRVGASDLYRVRRAQLEAERKTLMAQMAQNEARAILLEMEHKYGLLATDAVLDIRNGRVTRSGEEVASESLTDERSTTPGPT